MPNIKSKQPKGKSFSSKYVAPKKTNKKKKK